MTVCTRIALVVVAAVCVACGGRIAPLDSDLLPSPSPSPTASNDPRPRPLPEPPSEPMPTTGTVTVTPERNCAWNVEIEGRTSDLDLASLLAAELPSFTRCASPEVTVRITRGAVVGASSPAVPAMQIAGDVLEGASVILDNRGRIAGAGGGGGSGGNGGSGGDPRYCGRVGEPGGTALAVAHPVTFLEVGEIFGGGGGGGGASGRNLAFGGGGGAGALGGQGGAAATVLSNAAEIAFCGQDNGVRSGSAGAMGGLAPGSGRTAEYCRSGDGGGFGLPGARSDCFGSAEGGRGGHAIELRGVGKVPLALGAYDTGAGPIRGAIIVVR